MLRKEAEDRGHVTHGHSGRMLESWRGWDM